MKRFIVILLGVSAMAQTVPTLRIYQSIGPTNLLVTAGQSISNAVIFEAVFPPSQPTNLIVSLRP